MMDIKDLRKQKNMTQKEFAEYFQIPLRTLQEWEQKRSIPASYVIKMIARIIELEKLISS